MVTLMATLAVIWVVLEGLMGFRIGQINDRGIRLLDWGVDKGLNLMNTFFEKRKSSLKTFRSETMIDYTLMDNKCRSSVKDVKVILAEEKGSQHCLLLMDMVLIKKGQEERKTHKELESVDVGRD